MQLRKADFDLDGKPYSKLKVICPYKSELLQFATEFFLRLEEPDTQFIHMDQDESFFELFEKLWEERETFIIVEHDIVIWPGALHEMWECQEPFCAYQGPSSFTPVGGRRGLSYGLGCMKWHKSLIEKAPSLVKDWPVDRRHWTDIDNVTSIGPTRINDGKIHYHWPPVGHLSLSRFPIESLISKGGK